MKINIARKIGYLALVGFALSATAASAQEHPAFRIAIPRFKVPTGVQEESASGVRQIQATAVLRERLADLMCANIKKFAPQVQLLERREIDEAMKELKLSEDALFDSSQQSAKLGKFLKADYIVVGTTTICGTRSAHIDILKDPLIVSAEEAVLNFTIKILDVETAEIIDVTTWSGTNKFHIVRRTGSRDNKDPLVALSDAAEQSTVKASDSIQRHFWTELPAGAIGEDTLAIKIGERHHAKVGTRMQIFEEGKEVVIEGEKIRDRILVGEAVITAVQREASIIKMTGSGRVKTGKGHSYIAIRSFGGNK